VLQFAFVSALLCFLILAPTMLTIDRRPQNAGITISEIHLTVMPAWMPTRWFLPMHEQLRGTASPGMADVARRTALTTLAMAAGAIMITFAGYRRQLQLALTPPASTGPIGGARIIRAVARPMLGPNREAQAVCDFILATIARNKTQQAPIAISAAIGLAMLILGVVRQRGDIMAAAHAPAFVLAAPLVLVFWTCIGLRASFFVPSELPASWSFRANARAATSAYALGTRAAIVALVGPPAVLSALALATLIGGWLTAVFHASFVLLLVVAFADFVVLTIGDIPFTRPYQPGHAKLKTRWPLYVLGAYGFGNGLASLELLYLNEPPAFVGVLLVAAMVVAIFEWAVRRAGRAWSEQSGDDDGGAPSSVTLLHLAPAIPRQV
jgi:hypothetical protein